MEQTYRGWGLADDVSVACRVRMSQFEEELNMEMPYVVKKTRVMMAYRFLIRCKAFAIPAMLAAPVRRSALQVKASPSGD